MMKLVDVPVTKTVPSTPGGIGMSFRYMHRQITPPEGYEWYIDANTWDSLSPQGMIGVWADWVPYGRGVSLVTAGWGNLMQKPSYDPVWNDFRASLFSGMPSSATLTELTFMFVPKYCLLRETTYPYSCGDWPGEQMADLFLDNISIKAF